MCIRDRGKITLCYISQRICERESGCVSCYGFLYFCLTGSCLFLICLPISECDRFLAEFFNFDLNPAILTAPGSQIVLRVKNICPFQYRCWCYRRNRRWGRCGCCLLYTSQSVIILSRPLPLHIHMSPGCRQAYSPFPPYSFHISGISLLMVSART